MHALLCEPLSLCDFVAMDFTHQGPPYRQAQHGDSTPGKNCHRMLTVLFVLCICLYVDTVQQTRLFESNSKNVFHLNYLCNPMVALSGRSMVSHALLQDNVIPQRLYVFSLYQKKCLCLLA